MLETKKILILLTFLLLFSLVFVSADTPGKIAGLTYKDPQTAFPLAANRVKPLLQNAAVDEFPQISARAILVQDKNSGMVLYEKNAEDRLPIASLTKLMTAILVQKRVGLDEVVEITREDAFVSPYTVDLLPQEKLRVIDLLKAMLVSSANDATLALSRHVAGSEDEFVKGMNDEAKHLGMTDTSFTNVIGFDHQEHFSTARDLTLLVAEFLNYPSLVEIVKIRDNTISSVDGRHQHVLLTTNRLLGSPREIVGLKTGYTSEAKGNLILLVDVSGASTQEDEQYFSIILGSDNREEESLKVLQWVGKNFVWS